MIKTKINAFFIALLFVISVQIEAAAQVESTVSQEKELQEWASDKSSHEALLAEPAKSLTTTPALDKNVKQINKSTYQQGHSLTKSKQAQKPSNRNVVVIQSPLKENAKLAIKYWLQLYDFVGKSTIGQEQKLVIENYLKYKISSRHEGSVLGILKFWPQVEGIISASPEQRENYKSLLYSLLRLAAIQGNEDRSNEDTKYLNVLAQIIGPTRIRVAGSPPLTEDAIDAYSDMACFLYEIKHPGKSVDAMDNRAVFATLIADRFIEAPSLKDKKAMANFDLAWAKFKILWSGSKHDDQLRLLSKLTHDKGVSNSDDSIPENKTLNMVLQNGCWSN